MTKYWTFKIYGQIFNADFKSYDEAIMSANDLFAERCQDENPENGDEFENEITLIQYTYGDDGERNEMRRVSETIYYEHYHGDLAEHGTYHSGGGGVL